MIHFEKPGVSIFPFLCIFKNNVFESTFYFWCHVFFFSQRTNNIKHRKKLWFCFVLSVHSRFFLRDKLIAVECKKKEKNWSNKYRSELYHAAKIYILNIYNLCLYLFAAKCFDLVSYSFFLCSIFYYNFSIYINIKFSACSLCRIFKCR